jgi:hypothetical protein
MIARCFLSEFILHINYFIFKCYYDHFILLYCLLQFQYLLEQIFALYRRSFFIFCLRKISFFDFYSIQMTNFVVLLCIASIVMFNMSIFTGRLWVSYSWHISIFYTEVAINFTILVWFKVIEICICMRMTIFLAIAVFYFNGAIEKCT